MELFQVLHKNMPQKKKVFAFSHKKNPQDISKFLLQMIKNVKKETKDIRMINIFCIQIYDILYHDIMFGKIIIQKKLLRILEELALPINYVGEEKMKETVKKLKGIKI